MKRNKCASLGTCFWDLSSLNTSSKATRWSFYWQTSSNSISIITTKTDDNYYMICWVKINGRESGTSDACQFFHFWSLKAYIRLQKTNIKDEYRHIYFFNSVLNIAVCRPPLVDWQLLTPETTFGLLADKEGVMTFWKQISPVFLPLSLFSSLFFSRSLPSRRTPLPKRLEQATFNRNRKL